MTLRALGTLLLFFAGSMGILGNDFVPKGTTMGMVFRGPTMSRYDLSYGYSPVLALKVSRIEWDGTPFDAPLMAQGLQASYVFHRSFTEDGILNVYLIGGPFQVQEKTRPEKTTLGFEGALSADYETTQVYVRTTLERLESSVATQQTITVQALYAPWESSYNRPTLWFGVQGQVEKRHHEERSVAPIVRWVSRRWWVDAGVHVTGETRGKIFISVMHLF